MTELEDKRMDVKQVIVVRRDLNMRKGKMCAQVAHASSAWLRDGVIFKDMEDAEGYPQQPHKHELQVPLTDLEVHYLEGNYRKVVVWVRTEKELLDLALKAAHLENVHLQYDNGATEFHGERTLTCLAIGPEMSPNVDIVTGHLPLL